MTSCVILSLLFYVVVIDDHFKKDVIIIGFARMTGNHCAENVKTGVENIVNSYKFDKSKISGE